VTLRERCARNYTGAGAGQAQRYVGTRLLTNGSENDSMCCTEVVWSESKGLNSGIYVAVDVFDFTCFSAEATVRWQVCECVLGKVEFFFPLLLFPHTIRVYTYNTMCTRRMNDGSRYSSAEIRHDSANRPACNTVYNPQPRYRTYVYTIEYALRYVYNKRVINSTI